jgi:predicted ester cyclase
MVGEENKALVRLFNEEFWNKGNMAALDGAGHPPGRVPGDCADRQTGNSAGTVFYRFASGKITEFRGQFDGVALLQQLGAIPDHR